LRFVVAGSTLDGEESVLINAWSQLLFGDPQLAMVIAPRHPERFGAVAALLERSGVAWVRRSAWSARSAQNTPGASGHDFSRAEADAKTVGASAPDSPKPVRPGTIVLLDTIGELASVYSLASVAFVGGSLAPAGGHNPLEPAQFAVPIVMGPHYANFTAITEALREHDALRIATKEELAATLADLLGDRADAEAMGERAREVFEKQAGATDRCVRAIREILVAAAGEEPNR
jgi:3-deoxy-D-manno-octulosonic-acid transferase